MNNDNDVWYMRNDLTTYYVPNSLLNKSVTRTITIKEPGQADRTITQTAKLSRQVKVNGDDTGVTFEGFDGSGWKADSNRAYKMFQFMLATTFLSLKQLKEDLPQLHFNL